MNDILYRELHTIDELNRIFELEQAVWDMTPGDAVPSALLISVVENGGVVIGAELAAELVGFAFGIPARKGTSWYLWSYMAGVKPGYQARGIGFGLKAAQRQWALKRDYPVIKWTFDPMQRANANFNFRRLGVMADRYHSNHYGTMTDGLNVGMQSDRLEVTWQLMAPTVEALLTGRHEPQPIESPSQDAVLISFENGQIQKTLEPLVSSQQYVYIEMPSDLAILKRMSLQLAQEWQLAMRASFTWAFDAGYYAQQMIPASDGRYWYRLARRTTA